MGDRTKQPRAAAMQNGAAQQIGAGCLWRDTLTLRARTLGRESHALSATNWICCHRYVKDTMAEPAGNALHR